MAAIAARSDTTHSHSKLERRDLAEASEQPNKANLLEALAGVVQREFIVGRSQSSILWQRESGSRKRASRLGNADGSNCLISATVGEAHASLDTSHGSRAV